MQRFSTQTLHDEYKINRVVAPTYQTVSGAGKAPMDELFEQKKDYLEKKKLRPKILLNKLHLT